MKLKKKEIDSNTMEMLDIVVDFMCDESTSDEEIGEQVNMVSGKVRISLGVMSVRAGGKYKQAYDRFKKYSNPIKIANMESEKIAEIGHKKNLAIRSGLVTPGEKANIIKTYGDHSVVIGYPYIDTKTRQEKYKYTTIIYKESTPTLYDKTIKELCNIEN